MTLWAKVNARPDACGILQRITRKLSFLSSAGVLARVNMGAESQLINHLLSNYSRNGRPIINVTNPVQVSITFYLTQIMSLVSA
jgi:hypothetical protein